MLLNNKDINLTNDPLNGFVKYNLSYLQHSKEASFVTAKKSLACGNQKIISHDRKSLIQQGREHII